MICYYLKSETGFSHNGLGVLDGYIIDPVVTEELNGIFSLEFDYPIHAKHSGGLLPERIVRCPVPDAEPQLFRIAERGEGTSGLLHIVAYHIFYDLAQNLIEDTFVVNKTGAQAIAQVLGAAQFAHPFTGGSNIAVVSSSRLVRRNVAEALLDDGADNSFLNRWGGEVVRDNFHIGFQTVRGSDNGVAIRDKKNLTGYKADVDFGQVATRIMPEGYDGLLLPEKYVDSPRINDYNTPRIRVIKYDSVKAAVGERTDDEDAVPLPEAYAALRSLAAREYSASHIDVPKAVYDIQFAPLERTEEYREFATLEAVSIGDTVRVVHGEDGFDISARMVAYRYDPLTESYISVTLGNYSPRFTDVAKELRRVDAVVRQAFDEANFVLASANGKNVNYYGSVAPANPRKGDVWYKENGDKLEIWIYETREAVTQWYPLVSDLTQEELRQELDGAKEQVNEAKAAAESALEAGRDAKSAAEKAKSEADAAVEKADLAFADAQSALEGAGAAAKTADDAYDKSVKSSAVTYAVSASGTVAPTSGWQSTVPAVASGQFLWTKTVFTLQDNTTITGYSVSGKGADGVKGDTGATGPPGAAGTDAPKITSVKEQFYLSASSSALSGGSWSDAIPTWSVGKYYWTRVATSYSVGAATYSTPVLAAGLNSSLVTSLEAKSAAETLQSTVSQHATSISLNAGNITTLAGHVFDAESTLSIQAGQITAKASQTALDTLAGRVVTAESTITQQAESFSLSLSKQAKAINGLAGASVVQAPWQRGTLSASTGAESASTTTVRSGFLDVRPGGRYLLQTSGGANPYTLYPVTRYLHYYRADKSFLSYATQSTSTTPFTVPAEAFYLRVRFTCSDDPEEVDCCLLETDVANGYVDLTALTNMVKVQASTEALMLSVSETKGTVGIRFMVARWEQGTLNTSTGAEASATNYLRSGFIDVSPGERYIGQLPAGTAITVYYHWFKEEDGEQVQISYSGTSGAATVPASCTSMRVRTNTTVAPDAYTGNVYPGTVRADYSKGDTLYSAMLMQKDLINLRVAKGDVINQINVSTESILIAGNKVRITGQTTIDAAVITTAMIADAAVTNAKIGSLDAGKINTGTLSADRIAAGSITSAKLSIANGYITNAMIADATIASAKIAALDAAKITTGTLTAARIAAASITADKLATNAIQVGLAGWTSTIRITPTQISWYSGDTLEGYIDSAGMNFYYGTRFIGMMGESYDTSNSTKRGIATHLNGQGDYATWAYRTGTSGSYTRFLTFDPRNSLGNGTGISFGTHLWLNGYNLYTTGGRYITLTDNTLTNSSGTVVGTFPSLQYGTSGAKVTFSSTHLYLITNSTFYNCTYLMSRVGELISRVNSLIASLNNGWVKSITAGSNGSISWSYYSNTGLSAMSTTLS